MDWAASVVQVERVHHVVWLYGGGGGAMEGGKKAITIMGIR